MADPRPRRLVIVATAPDPGDELRERLRAYEDAEVMVVVPTSDLSFLEWLTNDEERARRRAASRARQIAETVPATVATAQLGDPDPLVAIEDALRTFPADELILVTRPGELATWLEKDALEALHERFGIPVVHLVDDDLEPQESGRSSGVPLEETARKIARGENPWLIEHAVLVIVAATALLILILALVASHVVA